MAKFSEQDLQEALEDLGTMKFFPRESIAAVTRFLVEAIPHRDALLWTVKGATSHCKEWPGLAGLREVLCLKYDALDGIDAVSCSIPGFTPYECEARAIAESEQYKAALPAGEARRLLAPFRGPKDGDV